MTRELTKKIVLLKQKVGDAKSAPLYQKANRVEACVEEAIFVIEEMATELARLENIVDDFVTNGFGLGEQVAEG